MLSRWRQIGSRNRSDTIDIARLLRLHAGEARVAPPAALRGRVLAALREGALRPPPTPPHRKPMGVAYIAACGLLVLLAAAATLTFATPRRPRPGPAGPQRSGRPLSLVSLDPGRLETALETRLPLASEPWEAPLREEARLLVIDARHARAALLSRLPRSPGG